MHESTAHISASVASTDTQLPVNRIEQGPLNVWMVLAYKATDSKRVPLMGQYGMTMAAWHDPSPGAYHADSQFAMQIAISLVTGIVVGLAFRTAGSTLEDLGCAGIV